MYELRTHTMRSPAALEQYVSVHWPRHLPSPARFDIVTHGIWTGYSAETHRMVALVSYPDGGLPDMVGVETVVIDPTTTSPLR